MGLWLAVVFADPHWPPCPTLKFVNVEVSSNAFWCYDTQASLNSSPLCQDISLPFPCIVHNLHPANSPQIRWGEELGGGFSSVWSHIQPVGRLSIIPSPSDGRFIWMSLCSVQYLPSGDLPYTVETYFEWYMCSVQVSADSFFPGMGPVGGPAPPEPSDI